MNYDRYLNSRIVSVPPSGIRRFFDLAASRKDAISLGVGEPDFKTPYLIRDAAINSLVDGETQYTGNRGLIELRREISYYLSHRYHISYQPETEILVTIGASEAIDLALRALVCEGDEVLVPDPSYVSYAPGVIFAGGVPVPVETRQEDDFRLKPDILEKAITDRTKLLILPYPNNPTGAIMEKQDLEAIAEVISRHDLLVISDEIYSELVYDGHTHTSFASVGDSLNKRSSTKAIPGRSCPAKHSVCPSEISIITLASALPGRMEMICPIPRFSSCFCCMVSLEDVLTLINGIFSASF